MYLCVCRPTNLALHLSDYTMSRLTQLKRMLSFGSTTEMNMDAPAKKHKNSSPKRLGSKPDMGILKSGWDRLPTELRQSIIMASLEDFLNATGDDWKAHLKSLDRAVRTVVTLDDAGSHYALWPLQKLRHRLGPELVLRQTEVDQVSKALTTIWSRWTTYPPCTAPAFLQREALEKELIKYRAYTRLKQLEDLEEILLRAIRDVAGLANQEKHRFKYPCRRKYIPDWRPTLLRQEELTASLSGRDASKLMDLVSRRIPSPRLPARVCHTHHHLDRLDLASGFRILFEIMKAQIYDIDMQPYAACCQQIC